MEAGAETDDPLDLLLQRSDRLVSLAITISSRQAAPAAAKLRRTVEHRSALTDLELSG